MNFWIEVLGRLVGIHEESPKYSPEQKGKGTKEQPSLTHNRDYRPHDVKNELRELARKAPQPEQAVLLYAGLRQKISRLSSIQDSASLEELMCNMLEDLGTEIERKKKGASCVFEENQVIGFFSSLRYISRRKIPLEEQKSGFREVIGEIRDKTAESIGLYLLRQRGELEALLRETPRSPQDILTCRNTIMARCVEIGMDYLQERGILTY